MRLEQSRHRGWEAQGSRMSEKECPHCGDVLFEYETRCTCGFDFTPVKGELRGAKAARDVSERIRDTGKKQAPTTAGRVMRHVERVSAKILGPAPDSTPSTRLMPCPSCRAQISKRAAKCPKCGTAPFAECQICSAKIRISAHVCPSCGDPDPFHG